MDIPMVDQMGDWSWVPEGHRRTIDHYRICSECQSARYDWKEKTFVARYGSGPQQIGTELHESMELFGVDDMTGKAAKIMEDLAHNPNGGCQCYDCIGGDPTMPGITKEQIEDLNEDPPATPEEFAERLNLTLEQLPAAMQKVMDHYVEMGRQVTSMMAPRVPPNRKMRRAKQFGHKSGYNAPGKFS